MEFPNEKFEETLYSAFKSSFYSLTAAASANQGSGEENNSIHKNKFMFAPCQGSYPCEGSDRGFRYPSASET